MGMDDYTELDVIYTSDDDPRAEDLKNCVVISLDEIPSEWKGNKIWNNTETYTIDLYHEEKLAINRIVEILEGYPSTLSATYDFLEKTVKSKKITYMERMKNGQHRWTITFDVYKTVEVTI